MPRRTPAETFRSTVARLWRATLAQMVCSVKLGEHPRANTQVPLCNSTQVWRQLTRLETARTQALNDLLLAFCDEFPANLDDSGWACDVESGPSPKKRDALRVPARAAREAHEVGAARENSSRGIASVPRRRGPTREDAPRQ